MQPCDELRDIVLHHYGKLDSGTQADSVKETYSLQEGVTIIGNDPNERVASRGIVLIVTNSPRCRVAGRESRERTLLIGSGSRGILSGGRSRHSEAAQQFAGADLASPIVEVGAILALGWPGGS